MKTQTIHIAGMTCSGCEKSVKEILESLAEVSKVIPDHKTGKVEIVANQHITNIEITEALPKKYALLDESLQQPSKLKQLFPLFLILDLSFSARGLFIMIA